MSLHIEIIMGDIVILSLTEQFKKELDNPKVISLVSMDLSKAFDTLPHDLIVKKLEDYGGDSNVINLITNYLSETATCQIEWTTLFYENYNEGCPPGINFGFHSL